MLMFTRRLLSATKRCYNDVGRSRRNQQSWMLMIQRYYCVTGAFAEDNPLDWIQPNHGWDTGIRVYNSLTRTKVPFLLQTPGKLNWYMCGPTVYDSAHVGHACCYVRFDIIRRILEEHFHINVFLAQGITDIDDKIVTRSRESDIPFDHLARTFESEFLRDMTRLGVRVPCVYTRVSEHIPDIVKFISRIIDRGYAYVSKDGSVYFDTQAFGARYGKLVPTRQNYVELPLALPSSQESPKRDSRDFALWKGASSFDIDEPSWPSIWGPGRPGWHIECSAMSSTVFGETLDLHTGGIDLMFPHHENEIAQCEACFDSPQWCNYFLHAGHIHIEGRKMSKSLKNFIPIKEFLSSYSARQFRLFCLSSRYSARIDYTKNAMVNAVSIESKLLNFVQTVRGVMRNLGPQSSRKWLPVEHALLDNVVESRVSINAALADDFDTPTALTSLLDIVGATNAYLSKQPAMGRHHCSDVLATLLSHVSDTLSVFGVDLETTRKSSVSTVTTDRLYMARILDIFSDFRGSLRASALKDPKKPFNSEVLSYCDNLRDHMLPPLGIVLKDRSNTTTWEEAVDIDISQSLSKDNVAVQVQRNRKSDSNLITKDVTPHDYLCAHEPGVYGEVDDDGVPLSLADGTLLSKKARKRLVKKLLKFKKRTEVVDAK